MASAGSTSITEHLDDCVHRGDPLLRVLRLACLSSVVSGGMKASGLKQLRRDLMHTYGYELLFTLVNLERAGLLKKQVRRCVYCFALFCFVWGTSSRQALDEVTFSEHERRF